MTNAELAEETQVTTEPSPFRDNGPYTDVEQAMRQFNAATFGIGNVMNLVQMLDLVLGEAVLMAVGDASEFETDHIREVNWKGVGLDPVATQILAAWLIRAHLAGYRKGKASWETALKSGVGEMPPQSEVEKHENSCSPDRCRFKLVDCPVMVAEEMHEVSAVDLAEAVGRDREEAAMWLDGLRYAAINRLAKRNLPD